MRKKVRVHSSWPLGFPVKDALIPKAARVKCHEQGGLQRNCVASVLGRRSEIQSHAVPRVKGEPSEVSLIWC